MLTPIVQRWQNRRASYRPAGEPIQTRLYEVAEILRDGPARDYVLRQHYSGSYPAARRRFGLYRGVDLVGVAVFSVGVNEGALRGLPGEGEERIELGRFVLDDDVPANGETWFQARCFEQLRRDGLVSVLSNADPMPRRTAAGELVFPGHVGTIYQASNAVYLGRGTSRTLHLLPDGSVLSARALQKLRSGETGWRYAAQQLQRHGAEDLQPGEDRRSWLRQWLPRVCTTQRHPGNHRYAWALQRGDRRHLPQSQPYPKFAVSQLQLPGVP